MHTHTATHTNAQTSWYWIRCSTIWQSICQCAGWDGYGTGRNHVIASTAIISFIWQRLAGDRRNLHKPIKSVNRVPASELAAYVSACVCICVGGWCSWNKRIGDVFSLLLLRCIGCYCCCHYNQCCCHYWWHYTNDGIDRTTKQWRFANVSRKCFCCYYIYIHRDCCSAYGKLSAFALRDCADIVNNHKFGTTTGACTYFSYTGYYFECYRYKNWNGIIRMNFWIKKNLLYESSRTSFVHLK